MQVNNVSFGSVIAVSGRTGKVNKVKNSLYPYINNGKVMTKDVTQKYINASSGGMLAQAAQKGDTVEIFITGEDVNRVKRKEPGWDTLEGVLSNLNGYIVLDRTSAQDAAEKIKRS